MGPCPLVGGSELSRGSELSCVAIKYFAFLCDSPTKKQTFITTKDIKMARLQIPPKNTRLQDLPDHDKLNLAIEWLRENPDEKPTTAARIYGIKKEDTLRKRWRRDKKKRERGLVQYGGQNKILTEEMH